MNASVHEGKTWSMPVNVDKTPAARSSFTPMIAVTHDGRVGTFVAVFDKTTTDANNPQDVIVAMIHRR